MASYNTLPAPAAAEEPLLQPKKSSRKHVVLVAALASFALGALAFTAVWGMVPLGRRHLV